MGQYPYWKTIIHLDDAVVLHIHYLSNIMHLFFLSNIGQNLKTHLETIQNFQCMRILSNTGRMFWSGIYISNGR